MFETLFDHPIIVKNTVLRKGLSFLVKPYAQIERAFTRSDNFRRRPPIIVNSLPKSGTHLLLQLTRSIPEIRYLGRFIASSPSITQKVRSTSKTSRLISRILPGETLGCHLYYSPDVSQAISNLNAIHIFIYRDPRDVIVSEIHYLSRMNRWHRMHKHYSKLSNFHDQLSLALDGLDCRYPNCNERLLPYSGWLNDPNTLSVRYEDLTGSNRDAELRRITEYLYKNGYSKKNKIEMEKLLRDSIDPSKSHTFRQGGSGKWKRELNEADAIKLNKRLAASLLQFGYETQVE